MMGKARAFVCGNSVALRREAEAFECPVTILWSGHRPDARNLKGINDILECQDSFALRFAVTNGELNLGSNVRSARLRPAATTVGFDKGKLEKEAAGLRLARNGRRMQLGRGDTVKL